MKISILNRMAVAAVLSAAWLVGMSMPANAQEQQQQEHPQKQDKKQQKKDRAQAKQQQKQEQQKQRTKQQQQEQKQQQRAQKQQQQDQNRQQKQRGRQPSQQQADRNSQQGQRMQPAEQRSAWQQHRANNWQDEHRSWQQRGGYNGYRIPDNRYRGHFGRGHAFRIYSYPVVVVGGYPRFQYDGFWFSLVDPWPGDWSDDWYDNDDVYIEYSNDGYYLYNTRHPGIGIAISISLN